MFAARPERGDAFLYARQCASLQSCQILAKNGLNPFNIDLGQTKWLKKCCRSYGLRLTACSEETFFCKDRVFYVSSVGKITKIVNCHPVTFIRRNCVSSIPDSSVNSFDCLDSSGDTRMKGDTLCAKNQLVQILTMCGCDIETRTYIFIDELIVEDFHLRIRAVPGSVLKHGRWRTAGAVDHHMGRIGRG